MAVFSSPKDSKGYRFHLELTQQSQDIGANTSVVYWKTYLTNETSTVSNRGMTTNAVVGGVSVLNDTNYRLTMLSTYSTLIIGSGTQTISHNADGTGSCSGSALMVGNSVFAYGPQGTHAPSGSIPLTTIPRASYPSPYYASRDCGAQMRHDTNRASSLFTHTFQYRFGTQAWATFATGITDTVYWTVPLALANNRPNNTSGTCEVKCITYNGATYVGESTSFFTFTIPNNGTFQPTASINSLNVVDGLSSYFVQGRSKVNTKSGGSGKYGASISQYRVTIDGYPYYGSDVTSGVISKNGTITVVLRVTDSRGFFTETSDTVTFQEYYSPKINIFTASRSPAQLGTDLSVVIEFDIATIANQNAKYYAVSYRETGGSWIEVVSSTSYYTRSVTHNASGVLDSNKSYEVKLELRDSYNTSSNPITITNPIGTVFKLMNFNASGRALAFGKVSELTEGMEIALPVTATKIIKGQLSNGVMAEATQGNPSFEVYSDATNSAYMTFHRSGAYGVRFGIDTDNQLKIGGWSEGAKAHTIYHTGNYKPKPIIYPERGGYSGGIVYSSTGIRADSQPKLFNVVLMTNPNKAGYDGYRMARTGKVFISRDWNGSALIYKVQVNWETILSGGGGSSLTPLLYWDNTSTAETTVGGAILMLRVGGYIADPQEGWYSAWQEM